MVATSAFGMGIDKPNIRYILHYQTPARWSSIQEIRRAGRDGHPAHCILLFDPADLEIHEHLQALSRPSVRHLERLEDALTAWTGSNARLRLRPLPTQREYRLGFARCWCPIFRRRASSSGIRKAASRSWCRPRASRTACAISSRSSRPFAMRASDVFDCLPTSRSRRNAGACSSGAILERTTHRVAERATAAAPTVLGRRSQPLCGGHTRDPAENLWKIGRSQCLLTPLLDRAASQQQKQHAGDHRHQQLPGRRAARCAQGRGDSCQNPWPDRPLANLG